MQSDLALQRIAMLGLLLMTIRGSKYVLSLEDYFTKWVERLIQCLIWRQRQ